MKSLLAGGDVGREPRRRRGGDAAASNAAAASAKERSEGDGAE